MPRFAHTIRFRLSLAFAVVVFTVGSLLIGGVYAWQVNRLAEPQLVAQQVNIVNTETGVITEMRVIFPEERQRVAIEQFEVAVSRRALTELRRASYVALMLLFVASFGLSWWLAGWALRPINRITGVAKEISGSDLSRRIGLQGPDDELKAVGDTFDAMLDRLEVAFDDQRRFVTEASHELRNPLAVARTNLEVALDEEEPEELRSAAVIAHKATGRMSALVDDLLVQARQGLPEVYPVVVDVNALVTEVVVDHKAPAAARSLGVKAELAPEQPQMLGDPHALRRALANLLANAIRLAPAGSTISVQTACASDQTVELRVVDRGPGLSKDDAARVFERFWRGDTSREGTGLGLSIVRQIAERHRGTASVESVEGVGSTFTLAFPKRD